jgi:hypothetical protein
MTDIRGEFCVLGGGGDRPQSGEAIAMPSGDFPQSLQGQDLEVCYSRRLSYPYLYTSHDHLRI